MKPVRILIDSTVDLPERCRAQVRAVPLTVHFGDEELIDGVTIDRRRFYERLIESDVLPTTSQATPAAFAKEFEAVRQAGESAVVITISAELSGTYQSACIAAADYEDIYVVDSRSAAIGSGILAELALEWAAFGVRVNTVSPTYILNDKNRDVLRNANYKRKYLQHIPLKRYAQPEDVANAILFLSSDQASMITGHNLMVDGGYTAV